MKEKEAIVSTRSIFKRIKLNWGLYLLILPATALLLCFAYKPMYGIIIAFKDFKPALGIGGSAWAGLKYFERFFNSYQFSATIINTLVVSIYSLIVSFPFPIILALMINQIRAGNYRKVFQTITYLPHFISTVVMVGLIIIFLSPSTGIVGNLGDLFGVEVPNLMGDPKAFSSIYVWSDVWQHCGWDSIIYIAALSAVDVSLYEAAIVDGASRWQKIIYIDIPMLLPTACILLIMRSGNIMNVGFEKVYLMQNSLNMVSSELISTYVYKMGLISSQYSLSAAVSLFNNVINFILLLTVNQVSKKLGNSSLW